MHRTQQAAERSGEPDFSEERDRAAGVARNRRPVSENEPPALAAGILRYGRDQAAGLLVSEREQGKLFAAVELGDDTRRPAAELSGAGVKKDGPREGLDDCPTTRRHAASVRRASESMIQPPLKWLNQAKTPRSSVDRAAVSEPAACDGHWD